MSSTAASPPSLRSRMRSIRQGQRRFLVLATLLGVAGLGVALWWQVERASGWQLWVVLSIALLAVASLAGLVFLRGATENMAEGDDAVLDERQRQVRDSAHRASYYLLGLLLLVAILASPQAILVLPALLLFNILPSAVIAWQESDPP